MSTPEGDPAIELDPARVADLLGEDPPAQVIDVREPHEREAGHIEGTRHVNLIDLAAQSETLDRDRPLVFYCRVGNRSEMAAQAFRTAGYDAYSLGGGLAGWVEQGRPLVPEGGYVADH